MKKLPINPYKFIPPELHQEVDSLMLYLTERPFQRPTECPYCGGHHFSIIQNSPSPYQSIPRYRCKQCKRTFSQLSNTYFARTRYQHLDKWAALARYRLSGYNITTTSHEIELPTATCMKREKVIEKIMQQECPQLFTWWVSHQYFQSEERTPIVQEQVDQFEHWLKTLLNQKRAVCPVCGRENCNKTKREKHRPVFVCTKCEKHFNLLSGTYLLNMYHPEHWITFTHLMLRGVLDQDIADTLHLDRPLCNRWRNRIIKQIQSMGFKELAEWLKWQRSRRRLQINLQAREKTKNQPAK